MKKENCICYILPFYNYWWNN